MPRKLVIACVLLAVVAVLGTLTWFVFDFPPPRLLIKYGLPPVGGPTGRTKTIAGMEFVEVEAGARKIRWRRFSPPAVERMLGHLGLQGLGEHETACWIEVPGRYWISRFPIEPDSFPEYRGPLRVWSDFEPPSPHDVNVILVPEDFEDYEEPEAPRSPCVHGGVEGGSPRIAKGAALFDWLSRQYRGVYRLPCRCEWLFSAASGALGRVTASEWGVGEWVVGDNGLETVGVFGSVYQPGIEGFVNGVSLDDFRLVWIPPEEE